MVFILFLICPLIAFDAALKVPNIAHKIAKVFLCLTALIIALFCYASQAYSAPTEDDCMASFALMLAVCVEFSLITVALFIGARAKKRKSLSDQGIL